MEKEREKMREIFEEFLFRPIEKIFGPFLNENARQHLSQAKIEVLKAMRSFIDSEIELMESKKEEE
ncbi:MAG: hypothetical protein ACUVQZ_07860 [Candidatus Caldatribacteriaceae bacterium]